MKTIAYLKTSLDRQEVQEQKLVILEFVHREDACLCYQRKEDWRKIREWALHYLSHRTALYHGSHQI